MLEVGGKGDSTFSSWDSALVRPDHQRGDEEAGWGGDLCPPLCTGLSLNLRTHPTIMRLVIVGT